MSELIQKSIPMIRIGNEVYNVKDLTARKHLIEITDTQPTSDDNKLWIAETEEEFQVPTYEEFLALQSLVVGMNTTITDLTARVEALEQRNDELSNQITDLTARVEALEQENEEEPTP